MVPGNIRPWKRMRFVRRLDGLATTLFARFSMKVGKSESGIGLKREIIHNQASGNGLNNHKTVRIRTRKEKLHEEKYHRIPQQFQNAGNSV